MNRTKFVGSIMLLITAIVWGCAFVAQSEAANFMGPFTFQAVRSIIGGVVLFPVIWFTDLLKKKAGTYQKQTPADRKTLLCAGIFCGVIFFAASMLQQYGITLGTSSGKAGFITAIYILLVPLIGLLRGKQVRPLIWGCIAVALAGLYLLCINGGFSLQLSDLLVLLCAVGFALHIVVIDRFASDVDGVRLSCIQFFVSGILSGVCMFVFESPSLQQLADGWITIAYAGVMSCGVAYTLQILGQQRTEPAVASLLMSFESVFAVLGGIVIQHQIPTAREWLGCALMFCAIIAAQLPERKKET